MAFRQRLLAAECGLLLMATMAFAQKRSEPALPPPATAPQAEFLQAADEVLADQYRPTQSRMHIAPEFEGLAFFRKIVRGNRYQVEACGYDGDPAT